MKDGQVIDSRFEICPECGNEIFEMERGICEACAQDMAGSGTPATLETLKEDYLRVNKAFFDEVHKE